MPARRRSWRGCRRMPEQGLQRRCDVGAVFDQALRAGIGLADFALGASLRNQS